jgi:hypothetical protein
VLGVSVEFLSCGSKNFQLFFWGGVGVRSGRAKNCKTSHLKFCVKFNNVVEIIKENSLQKKIKNKINYFTH